MASSSQIQVEISKIEAAIEAVNAELDRLYAEFGKALPTTVEAWMKSEIQRRIEDNAEAVNSRGIDVLRLVKADLSALISDLPRLCELALGSSDKWPHRQSSKPSVGPGSNIGEQHPAATFRRAINHLGELLDKHALIAEKPGYSPSWKREGGSIRYAINPGFDERQYPALMQYQDKRKALTAQNKLLDEKRGELAKAQARELWNEA